MTCSNKVMDTVLMRTEYFVLIKLGNPLDPEKMYPCPSIDTTGQCNGLKPFMTSSFMGFWVPEILLPKVLSTVISLQ